MLPLLTFATGLVAGAVGVRLLKSAKAPADLRATTAANLESLGGRAREGLDRAREGLRGATVSGLSAIERSSASLRGRLAAAPAGEDSTAPETPLEAPAETPAPTRRRRAAKAATEPAPAKAARRKAKAPAPETGAAGGEPS